MCKFTTDAIITEGRDVGTVHKVCTNPSCPVHHPKQQIRRDDDKWKTEREKQLKEQAIAKATGLRVLAAVGAAVPVRLMKRDLLFILEKLTGLIDEGRLKCSRGSTESGRRGTTAGSSNRGRAFPYSAHQKLGNLVPQSNSPGRVGSSSAGLFLAFGFGSFASATFVMTIFS